MAVTGEGVVVLGMAVLRLVVGSDVVVSDPVVEVDTGAKDVLTCGTEQ